MPLTVAQSYLNCSQIADNFFKLLFGCPNVNFGSFSRRQSHANLITALFYFDAKATRSLVTSLGL